MFEAQEGQITPEEKPTPTLFCGVCGKRIDADGDEVFYHDDLVQCEKCFDETLENIISDIKYDAKLALQIYLDNKPEDDYDD